MDSALTAALTGLAALLLVLSGSVFALAWAVRRRAVRALDASRAEVEALTVRLEDLEQAQRQRDEERLPAAAAPVVGQAEFVITDAGKAGAPSGLPPVTDRALLSFTLGEPLVKTLALGYGVRRALSPASRNRIAFEMRREVKRARRERRRTARRVARTRPAPADSGEAAA